MASATLVGRTDELLSLDEVVTGAREGTSAVRVLRGEAGIGKTALLEHAAATPGFRLVRVAGIESETELGFGALHQLLLPFLPSVETLPGPQRDAMQSAFGLATGPIPDQFLIGVATLTMLTDAAASEPLLVIVDDAQWIDQESLTVLAFVARRLCVDDVAMLFAVRTPGEPPNLVDLPGLEIRGIPDDQALQLLDVSAHSRVDDQVAAQLVRDTGANPLALVELADALTTQQLAGEASLPDPLPIGRRLQRVFLAQLDELPPAAQTLILIAAADTSGDPALLLRAASELGVDTGYSTMRAIERFVTLGPNVQFRHPLIRSAVYQHAAASERRRVHLALAGLTEDDPEREVWHRAAAAFRPDEDVATALEQSALRTAVRGGYATAARMMTRSVELTEDESKKSGRLLLAAGAALVSGNAAAAQSTVESATARLETPTEQAEGLRLRGVIRFARGETGGEPVSLLMQAAQAFAAIDARRARDALFEAFEVATWTSRDATLEVAQQVRALSPDAPGEPTTLDKVLDAFVVRMLDGYPAAAPKYREAIAAVLDDKEELRGFNLASIAAGELWDLDAAIAVTQRWVDDSRAKGALATLPLALVLRMAPEYLKGRFAIAMAICTEALELSKATAGILGSAGHGADLILAWTGPEADARAAADAHFEEGLRRGQGTHGALVPQLSLGFLELGLGNFEAARVHAAAVFAPDFLGPVSAWGLADLVEAAARSGHRDEAEEALARLRERARASAVPTALGHLMRGEGILADDDHAEDCYREALDHFSQSPALPDRARTHLLYGEWLTSVGRTDDAQAALMAAHSMFDNMNAEFFVRRAAAALAAIGQTVRRRVIDPARELTAQELQVAQLAAHGATNREIAAEVFISASTVDYHLRKVFRKLGITTRKELGAAFASSG
jgi:DNA-binding CsgD family transcriptional regulator